MELGLDFCIGFTSSSSLEDASESSSLFSSSEPDGSSSEVVARLEDDDFLLSPLDVDRVWWRHSKFPRSRPVSTSVSQSKKMRFFICLYRWVVVHPSDFCLYDLNLFSLFPPVCFDTRFSVYGFGLNFTGIFFLDSGKRIYIIPGSQQIFVSTPLTNYCVRRSQNNFVLWENKKVLYTKKCFKSILRVCFDL